MPAQIPTPEFSQERRKALLGELARKVGDEGTNRTAWACLWLSHIEKLEQLVDLAGKVPHIVKLALDGMVQVNLIDRCSQASNYVTNSFANTN
jgi:hypothetical protein